MLHPVESIISCGAGATKLKVHHNSYYGRSLSTRVYILANELRDILG